MKQKNPQGTNSDVKEPGVQIKDLEDIEEINSQTVQNGERIKRHEERVRRLWDISTSANIESWGCQQTAREAIQRRNREEL